MKTEATWEFLRDLAPALRIGAGWRAPIAAAIGGPAEPAVCRVVTRGWGAEARMPHLESRLEPRLEFRCLSTGPEPLRVAGGHPAIRWRATEVPLPQMCIVGEALLIFEQPPGKAVGCLAMPTISLLANTFDAVWDRAAPVVESPGPPDDLAEVLAQLATGATDRRAQRGANLSARTFSRKVAELMRVLGAASRFQAGAEAARRGWI